MNPTSCQVYINPHHLHPLFTDGRGTGRMSLQRQAALLFLKRNNIAIHRLLGVNHKAIEDMETRLRSLREVRGGERKGDWFCLWCQVERCGGGWHYLRSSEHGALAENKAAPIAWEQWCGLVKRGHPDSLMLHRLSPKISEARAGAIRKVECLWLSKWLKGKDVILHTDAAKSYKCKIPGVVRDNVVRCKKKVKIHGKWKWQAPNYVPIVAHKVPGQKGLVRCKAGT